MIDDTNSLPLLGCSWLGGTRDIIVSSFANKCGRQFHYEVTLLYIPLIIQDARPKIVDALLTLIFKR